MAVEGYVTDVKPVPLKVKGSILPPHATPAGWLIGMDTGGWVKGLWENEVFLLIFLNSPLTFYLTDARGRK